MRAEGVRHLAIAAGLAIGLAGQAWAAASAHPKSKAAKPGRNAAAPALASGTSRSGTSASSAPYAAAGTVKTFVNVQGETVFVVSPAHFDRSAPLSEMAATAAASRDVKPREIENELNPQLPLWLQVHSAVPDPVVQPAASPLLSRAVGAMPAAPSNGFSFNGVVQLYEYPPDNNGAAGNNQFVEIVNTRYQIWSLNRTTKTATALIVPKDNNTLWAGFGGPCQDQNSGDPIVLYDKTANRWLISQFTSTAVSNTYYQCVAISQTADATGAYYRYAFAVPAGVFGDYPHFGVWTDAYYMMAHGFTTSSPPKYVAAIFAAMDRTKMLAGDPTATWQVFQDPAEGGHVPADLDGFALPPTGAPGIFVSAHAHALFLYRMKLDFANPANSIKTLQGVVPTAPFTGACYGIGACVPEPGTTQLVDAIGDRLMFRAAYRNFVDHESLVVTRSVDPSISGVVSGIRWYDVRLSGTPNATCPSYPCLYQQGTIADVSGGRSRWMPSIAMDSAENILVGYSTTGTQDGTDNHSIRYTGRAKSDPPGTMTAPETIIATGTKNAFYSRWGDYTSTTIDPYDDCTFWHVNQYLVAPTGLWVTRVASASYPPGDGPGQCAPSSCLARPTVAASIGSAAPAGDNAVTVTWQPTVPASGSYAIERAEGACGSEGLYRPLAAVDGSVPTYTDTDVQGGLTYAYRVIAASDAVGRCQAEVASACVQATATGVCRLAPSFGGVTSAAGAGQSTCGVTVQWQPATARCPLTPSVRYSIFRGTTPDFIPSAANRVATCVLGPDSYLDAGGLQSGTTYFYAVRAEDGSSGGSGDCGGGNEDANVVVAAGTPYGPGLQATPGTWTDGGGDGTAQLAFTPPASGGTSDPVWRFGRSADDPGTNHTPGGSYAYRNGGPRPNDPYASYVCADLETPPLVAGSTTVDLNYWERHQMEYQWDGLALEYSVNGAEWDDVPPPSNKGYLGCNPTDDLTGWSTLACTGSPPANACSLTADKRVLTGPVTSGSSCTDWATSPTVPEYAHRCHPIAGLTPGDVLRFRWRFTTDVRHDYEGFYLDDIAVTNVLLPNACTPDACSGQPDGAPCDDGNVCTTGDSCAGGACQPGPAAPAPAEVAGLALDGASSTTLTWTDLGGGAHYDVASSTLSDLRASGTATATCLSNDQTGTTLVDPRPDPAPGYGYYYIVRGQTACASGTYGFDSSSVERLPTSGCP